MIKVTAQAAAEMEDEKTEPKETPNEGERTETAGKFSSELSAQRWSVVTFEKCAAKNLSYFEAAEKIRELNRQNVSGLCIITDEAAQRLEINC